MHCALIFCISTPLKSFCFTTVKKVNSVFVLFFRKGEFHTTAFYRINYMIVLKETSAGQRKDKYSGSTGVNTEQGLTRVQLKNHKDQKIRW